MKTSCLQSAARLRYIALLMFLTFVSTLAWGDTYEQLTSIANIDESAEYVLGIDGTGFHYEGTSSWGKTALPSAQTPIKYTLTKASDGNSFTAQATISGTTYYLQIPTSNTFSMATSTGTNTDIIIGTTQVSGTNYAVANKTTTARHLRINGTDGLRSYAGTTGTMAYFYKVVVATTATVTYDANGGSGTMTDSNSPYNKNSTVTVLANTFTAPAGKTYAHWNTAADGSGTDYDPDDTFTISSDITLFAQWALEDGSDGLNRELTGVTSGSTTYSDWSGKSGSNSDAVYTGNSAGGYNSIQLRSENNSGIVTTTSGGKAKSVTVTWNSNTQSGRTLNVYGKNTAYTAASELYSSETQGTLLGTIVCGTSTSLNITGDYEYIGLRSNSGAMYLTEITISWFTCQNLAQINGSVMLAHNLCRKQRTSSLIRLPIYQLVLHTSALT